MIKWEKFTDPLFDSNCYFVIENSACIVVDPNHPRAITESLTRNNRIPELVFLTHEHCDHMAGLDVLRAQFPAAKVIISEACSEGLQDKRINMTRMAETYLAFAGKPGITYRPFVPVEVTPSFGKEHALRWRGHEIRFVSLPGHSPGSTGIWIDGDMFFSGDYLLTGKEPVLRLPGGSEILYQHVTVPVLQSLPEGIRIFPGHGEPYVLKKQEF